MVSLLISNFIIFLSNSISVKTARPKCPSHPKAIFAILLSEVTIIFIFNHKLYFIFVFIQKQFVLSYQASIIKLIVVLL